MCVYVYGRIMQKSNLTNEFGILSRPVVFDLWCFIALNISIVRWVIMSRMYYTILFVAKNNWFFHSQLRAG